MLRINDKVKKIIQSSFILFWRLHGICADRKIMIIYFSPLASFKGGVHLFSLRVMEFRHDKRKTINCVGGYLHNSVKWRHELPWGKLVNYPFKRRNLPHTKYMYNVHQIKFSCSEEHQNLAAEINCKPTYFIFRNMELNLVHTSMLCGRSLDYIYHKGNTYSNILCRL